MVQLEDPVECAVKQEICGVMDVPFHTRARLAPGKEGALVRSIIGLVIGAEPASHFHITEEDVLYVLSQLHGTLTRSGPEALPDMDLSVYARLARGSESD
jgi:hypothetical protein